MTHDDHHHPQQQPQPQQPASASSKAGGFKSTLPTATEARHALEFLTRRHFIGARQACALGVLIHGEEGPHFAQKLVSLRAVVEAMPETYQQDGMGDQAVVSLHYFRGRMDWFITEKDCEPAQLQAFGLADFGDGGELGYISLVELARHNVELDLYFAPCTLAELRAQRGHN